jgi:hypothetical protein
MTDSFQIRTNNLKEVCAGHTLVYMYMLASAHWPRCLHTIAENRKSLLRYQAAYCWEQAKPYLVKRHGDY